jgi:large subunit ribosomal protein L6
MSKIGRKTITIPQGVTVDVQHGKVTVTGPKGTLGTKFDTRVKILIDNDVITIESTDPRSTQYQGLYRTLISNYIEGVTNGVSKKLEFNGIGYKANVSNGNLVLNVGYSHPVEMKKIDGVEFNVTDNVITVSGIDKVLVGDIAAKIRKVRPPEPYKGKGIKYQNEVIIRKETKSA